MSKNIDEMIVRPYQRGREWDKANRLECARKDDSAINAVISGRVEVVYQVVSGRYAGQTLFILLRGGEFWSVLVGPLYPRHAAVCGPFKNPLHALMTCSIQIGVPIVHFQVISDPLILSSFLSSPLPPNPDPETGKRKDP